MAEGRVVIDKKIFVHGWATDSGVWADVARGLTTGGGGVGAMGEAGKGAGEGGSEGDVMYGLPGHVPGARWLEPSLNPALAGLKRAMGSGDGRFIGVGWSLGAEVLLLLAAHMPQRFSALVLAGATPCFVQREGFPHGQPRALVRRMIMDMKRDPVETLKRFYPLNFTEEERETGPALAFMRRYAPPGPLVCGPLPGDGPGKGSAPACRPAFDYKDIAIALEALYNTDIRDILSEIEAPALLVHGGADAVVPVGAAEFMAAKMARVRLEILPRAGHAPFVTNREWFLKTVQGFLKERAAV